MLVTAMVPSPKSLLLNGIVTSAEGSLSRNTLKVAETPASEVFPLIGLTIIPAASSSPLVIFTVALARASKKSLLKPGSTLTVMS